IKMLQVCFRTRFPRPLARAWKRFRNMPRSTKIVFTFSVSMSAPSLCSALAMADSSTLRMMPAPFLGMKASALIAWSTGLPRIRSATSLPFWADRRTPRRIALVSMFRRALLLRRRSRRRRRGRRRCGGRRRRALSAWRGPAVAADGFLGALADGGVALEDARHREFAELVSDHVLGHVHRYVLLAVVYGHRQPDEVGDDGRAPRPGLDRPLVIRAARRVDLLHQVVVHEGTLLD